MAGNFRLIVGLALAFFSLIVVLIELMWFLYRNTAPTVLKSDLLHYTYLTHSAFVRFTAPYCWAFPVCKALGVRNVTRVGGESGTQY